MTSGEKRSLAARSGSVVKLNRCSRSALVFAADFEQKQQESLFVRSARVRVSSSGRKKENLGEKQLKRTQKFVGGSCCFVRLKWKQIQLLLLELNDATEKWGMQIRFHQVDWFLQSSARFANIHQRLATIINLSVSGKSFCDVLRCQRLMRNTSEVKGGGFIFALTPVVFKILTLQLEFCS